MIFGGSELVRWVSSNNNTLTFWVKAQTAYWNWPHFLHRASVPIFHWPNAPATHPSMQQSSWNVPCKQSDVPPLSYPVWNKISGDIRWTLSSQPSCLNLVERLWIPTEASLRATAWQVNLRWLANVLLSLDYIMSYHVSFTSHGLMVCHWSPNKPPQFAPSTSNLRPSLLKAGIRIQTHQIRNQHAIIDSASDSPCFRSWELSHQHGWFNCGHCSTEVTFALAFDHCFCYCSTEQPCSCLQS